MIMRRNNADETPAILKELGLLWSLTWPVSATFFLNMSLSTVSVLFVGHLGASKLAATSLATSLAQITGNSVLRGIASAMNTLCGQSYGAGAYEMVGIQFQRATIIVSIASLPIIAAWTFADALLNLIGQDPTLASMTATYLRYRIPGLLFYGLYICTSNWLQAQGIVRPAAVAATITALLHPMVNYFTIHILGMDYLGAAVATTCAYGMQLFILCSVVWYLQVQKKTWHGWSRECLRDWLPYLRLAIPGLLLMSELWASEAAVMMAGLLRDPALSLAAMAIYQTINGLYFMLPLGMGASAAIRVANELGAGHPMRAKRAAELAVVASAVVMTLLALPILPCREAWTRTFTNDDQVAEAARKLLLVLIPYVVFDALQTVVTGVMRGQGRQASVVPVVLICYYAIGLPLCYIFAFRLDLQVLGLCLGMLVGTVLHALVFLYLMYQADWDQDARDAQQWSVVSTCAGLEDPEDIFHSGRQLSEGNISETSQMKQEDDVEVQMGSGPFRERSGGGGGGDEAGHQGTEEVGGAGGGRDPVLLGPRGDRGAGSDAADGDEGGELQALLPKPG